MRRISENCYEFGEFRLDADEKILWRGDSIAEATPKALEILLVLVKNAGRIVSKEEIFGQVWADSFVEDANLSHHIFRLRKILGENDELKFIETVPKRGYRFVAEIKENQALNSTPHITSSDVSPPRFSGKRNLLIFSTIFLLLAVGATGFVWYKSGAGEQQTETVNVNPKIQNPMTISRITNGGKYGAATISPDGKFVAYVQNYTSGEGMLYIRQIETNTEIKLLAPAERNFGSISFSPDGTFIYYIAYEPTDPEGALYRIPVIGGGAVKVLDNVKFMFSLSPDGKRAAFYRFDKVNKQTQIVHSALDGSFDEKIIFTCNDEQTAISSVPAFSPDGRLLSFSTAENAPGIDFNAPQFSLFTIDLESREIKKLSEEKWQEIGKTVWMNDGSGLIFVGNRPRLGIQIYFLSYPSGGVRQITDELNNYSNYGMSVSRDGTMLVADLWESQAQLWQIDANDLTKQADQLTNGTRDGSNALTTFSDGRIIYSTLTGDDIDLWILSDVNGIREGKPLTSDAFTEGGVCSPADDRFIIFASDRTGLSHLFKINPDGSNLKQITFSETPDGLPNCAPDGSFIIYEANSTVWKISSDGGTPARLTDFECAAPSLSPDAKSFACIQPTGFQIKNALLTVIETESGKIVKTFEIIPFGFYYRPPIWSLDGQSIIFKKTEKQIGNLWRQNLSGGEPKQITNFKSDVIFNHSISRDGKKIILSRGKFTTNIVMLKNFK
ncbi:hypothetical protein BH20ACI4_BH20ACI4_05930 [soil metagenome]